MLLRHRARKVTGCPFKTAEKVSVAWNDWDTVVDSINAQNEDITTATVALSSITGFPIHPSSTYTVTSYNGYFINGVSVSGGNLIYKILRPEEVCALQTAVIQMSVPGCPKVNITAELISSDQNQDACILIDTSYTCATNPASGLYVDGGQSPCEPCPNRQLNIVGGFDPFAQDTLFSEWWRSQQTTVNPPHDTFSRDRQMSGSGIGGVWALEGAVFSIGSYEETLRTVEIGGNPQLDYSLRIKDVDGTVVHNILGSNNVDTGAGVINCGDQVLIQLYSNDLAGVVSLGDMTALITLN